MADNNFLLPQDQNGLNQLLLAKSDDLDNLGDDENVVYPSAAIQQKLASNAPVATAVQRAASDKNDDDDSDDNDDVEITPEDKAKADLLDKYNKFTGKTPVTPNPNISNALSLLMGQQNNALINAQRQRNNMQLIALLGEAGQAINKGFTPYANHVGDDDFYKNLLQASNQGVQDIGMQSAINKQQLQDAMLGHQLQTQLAQSDPNSPQSQLFRQSLLTLPYGQQLQKRYGTSFNNITAADKPNITDLAKMDTELAMRNAQIEATKAYREVAFGKRNNNDLDNQAKAFAKSLDLSQLRQNTPAGRAQSTVDATNRIQALLDQYPNPNEMPPERVEELAIALNSMLTGSGNIAHEQTKRLVPASVVGDVNRTAQWLTNQQRGAGLGSFINNLADTIHRERAANMQIVQNYQNSTKKAWAGSQLANQQPERYSAIADAYMGGGPNVTSVPSANSSSPAGQSANNYSSDVLDYAKKHNITPVQAAQIKALREGKVAKFADGGEVKQTLGQLIHYPGSDDASSAPAQPKTTTQPQSTGNTLGHDIGYPGMYQGGLVRHYDEGGEVKHTLGQDINYPYEENPNPTPAPTPPPTYTKNDNKKAKTLGQLFNYPTGPSMSSGGEVPGKPKVAHNSKKNDVVPAMLTPEEIVLPLSVTKSDNPPDAAKNFVEHILKYGKKK